MSERRGIEAASWAARRAEPDAGAEAERRFARWHADPLNADAYREAAATLALTRGLADSPDLQALRRATLSRVARRGVRRAAFAPRLAAAAAALLVVALPLGLVVRAPMAAATEYRTDRGQKLDVTLEDGSRVTLDTDSRVRLAYTARERRLVLLAGQARFEVAKHQPRPFIVEAGEQQVTAHGTEFDVRLDPAQTRVALIEGRVTVAAPGAPVVAMRPGELLVTDARGRMLKRDPRAVEALTSWNEGLVIAQDEPLATVAAEMSRYARRPIRVEGAAARIRVSGAFRAGATESFAEALALGFPVRAERGADGAIVLVPAAPKK